MSNLQFGVLIMLIVLTVGFIVVVVISARRAMSDIERKLEVMDAKEFVSTKCRHDELTGRCMDTGKSASCGAAAITADTSTAEREQQAPDQRCAAKTERRKEKE